MRFTLGSRSATGERRSERDAFDQMLQPCLDRLWRCAYRLARNSEDAEDLLAEALVEGYRSFASYRGDSSFATWMYRILTTTFLDERRKSARRPTQSLEELTVRRPAIAEELVAGPDDEPEATLMRAEFSEEIERALRAIPEEYRATLILADVEEMDYREVARILGVPVGTVRSRLHRARRALRAALTGGGIG